MKSYANTRDIEPVARLRLPERTLLRDPVACWYVDVQAGEDREERALLAILDDVERARYAQFLHRGAQRSFLVAHAALRLILAHELRSAASDIAYTFGAAGKPALARGGPHFNMSHSADLVAIAVSRATEVGIDVESIRPMDDRADVARRFFHSDEVRQLAALDEPAAETAFFRCWTRKEAVSKAVGLGLSLPLDTYRVTCAPGDPASIVLLPTGLPDRASWSLIDLPVGNAYAGAIALPSPGATLVHRTLDAQALRRAIGDPSTLARAAADAGSVSS